ncbi:hypothetical protein PMAYCL1PPCAC_10159, partial [Pristionchus mayeri]
LPAMATSYRQARKDDSSDDEGPTKRIKHNDHDDDDGPVGMPRAPAANKKARNVWVDVVQEEELAIRSNVMDMGDYSRNKAGSMVKIRRGAESYVVPAAQLEENAAALEAGENMEEVRVPAPAASDDPFGDTADIGEVEAFGVGPASRNRGNWQPRARGRGVRGGWMNKSRGDHSNHAESRGEGAARGDEMDTGEGDAGEGGVPHRGGRGGRGGWRGQRGGGFIPRGRGAWRGGHDDRKRRWNNDGAHAKDPAELMEGSYSLAGLMATEFQEGLTPKELGEQIAKALGEKVSDTVVKICEAVGEKKALEIFEETKKAEQAGGLKVADGSRRRTPGGVFILMFKSDIDVEPAVKSSIFEDSKIQQRKIVKAKRRSKGPHAPQDVDKGLDELQAMLDAKKRELQEGKKDEKEEGEATPSPENDGAEELDYTEEDEDDGSPEEETEME